MAAPAAARSGVTAWIVDRLAAAVVALRPVSVRVATPAPASPAALVSLGPAAPEEALVAQGVAEDGWPAVAVVVGRALEVAAEAATVQQGQSLPRAFVAATAS